MLEAMDGFLQDGLIRTLGGCLSTVTHDHERGTKLHIMSRLQFNSDIESNKCFGESQFTWSLPRLQTYMITLNIRLDTTDVRMYIQDDFEQNV